MGARSDVERLGAGSSERRDSSSLMGVGFVKAGEVRFPFVFGEPSGSFGNLGRGKAVFLAKSCVHSVVSSEVLDVCFGVGVVE